MHTTATYALVFVTALLVVAAVIGAAFIFLNTTKTPTGTQSLRTSCGFPAQGTALFVRVVGLGNGSFPIAGETVVGTLTCNGSRLAPEAFVTNSSGYIFIPSPDGSSYAFSLNFFSQNYRFNATIRPLQTTYDTVFLPVGGVQETLCNDMATPRTCSTTSTKAVISSSYTSTPEITSMSGNTCSGYPPGGNCLATYSYTFTLSVNYSGPWKLSYRGYNSVGVRSNPTNVSGSYTGTGFYSRNVTLSGLNNSGLTLCAQAQKLDSSNSTLILKVTGYNETSLPYGSTSYCGGVVP